MLVTAAGHPRPVAVEVAADSVNRDVVDLEPDVAAGLEARRDEVLDDLLLAVHDDAAPGELGEVDAVPRPREAQLGAVVRHALGIHALADAGFAQRVGGAVLEYARAHPRLDVVATASLEHDRVDALQVQELGQQQAGGTGADDHDLGAHTCQGAIAGRAAGWPTARSVDERGSQSRPGRCLPS